MVRTVSVARAAKAVRSAAGSVMLNSATTGRSVQHFSGSMTHALWSSTPPVTSPLKNEAPVGWGSLSNVSGS